MTDGTAAREPVWHGLTAGGISAIASRICTHPADTVKARLQMQGTLPGGAVYHSTLHAFRSVAAAEGIAGFYRGFGAILGGVVPASAAYFGGYESGKLLVPAGAGVAGDVAVGVWAQLVAGVVYTPIDIVKERLQVQSMMGSAYRYSSTWAAVRALTARRGAAGLLRGYWATNAVWLPWNAIYVASYEASKRGTAQALGLTPSPGLEGGGGGVAALPAWAVAGCAATSSTLAVTLTHPADVVKTRLQVMDSQRHVQVRIPRGLLSASPSDRMQVLSASAQTADVTAVQLARLLYAQQGMRGFSAGLLARVLTIAPGNAISWLVYERAKRWLADAQ